MSTDRRPNRLDDAGAATQVVAWQRRHGRHGLPWQSPREPYQVWLSEVMLQQTQVTTVLDYYPRFLARFPDVSTLAAASLDEVLALWSGLGYYSRARHLHRCAQVVVAEHQGRFPATAEALARLPGIGRSTAAAIAAFCFGERVAILDGNVKRVLSRLLGYSDDLAVAAHERQLWQLAGDLLPADSADMPDYTQGLMDLGATVCTVKRPDCPRCPLMARCAAHTQGRPEAYPVKTRRLKRSQRANAWLWLDGPRGVWMQQRPSRGVWAGLWCLPLFDDTDALEAAVTSLGVTADRLPPIDHVLTHFDWRLTPWRASWPSETDPVAVLGQGRWIAQDKLHDTGLPAPLRKLLLSPPAT